MTFSALVVGAGKVGSRFDEEPGRKSIWTHVGAYLSRPTSFRLAGVCEPNQTNAEAFQRRCPGVPVYRELRAALDSVRPDVVSICTPTAEHAACIERSLLCESVRAVWCEKPLTTTIEDANASVRACSSRGVHLVVSFVRRWMPLWRRTRELIESGSVGTVRVVRVSLPNRLWSMGSHALDLIQFLGGPISDVVPFALPQLEQEGEVAAAAMLRMESGAYAIFQVIGLKTNYIVEAEVVGDEGRIFVREDTGVITVERFEPSTQYEGYRELGRPERERVRIDLTFSPFVAIADEISALISGGRAVPTCDGRSALAVQMVLERMAPLACKV
jgi:predicted dehydrogenase